MNIRRWISLLPVALLLVELFLTGCAGVPVIAHAEGEFVGEPELKSLIGSNKPTVRRRLGEPDRELEGLDKDYYVYYAIGKVDVLLEFMAIWPIPLPGSL